MKPLALAGLLIALTCPSWAAEPQRGVTDTEIIIGTATDLSGVTAVQGVNSADAIRLAFDELNAAGGINGRKIHYIVEDTQYQVPRAVQAINKLINSDGVFFTLEDGGTPMNNATFPMASSDSAKILRFLWTTAKPARKAANTRLTSSAPAMAQ